MDRKTPVHSKWRVPLMALAIFSLFVPIVIYFAGRPNAHPPGVPAGTNLTPRSGDMTINSAGVPAGTNLTTQKGNMTISSAGTIVENQLINGCITVNAANVIIRKSKIFCSGTAIQNNSTDLLVEDSEISCKDTPGTALTWQNFTARRINAYACENIIWAENNVLIEDSYIHDPIDYDPATDPHTDAIQIPEGAS